MITVRGLTKRYRATVAVEDVSFDIGAEPIVGLLGPNGAGKTTTIKCLCGLVRPTAGSVAVDNIDVVERPRAAAAKVAAVLEGNRNIYWRLTVRENLEFFAALHGRSRRSVGARIDDLIERFGLGEKRNAPARMLSKGTQQKLALACAFVKGTPVLLLDEPTLGLDVEASYELRAHLREIAASGERTIVLSSHDMAVVQDVCERVIIINGGRIVTDDRVSHLLDVFRARAFRFTVLGRVQDLSGRFPLIEVTEAADRTLVDVELLEPAAIYDVIDALRAQGATLESIERREPNLEEIFLEVVRKAPA